MSYDFSGWCTRNDLRCSDGRIIRKDAFKDNDGETVPLVWNHQHNDPMNVLGHAELENRPQGVYAYCTFNDTIAGQNAKQLVKHGDVNALSIFANHLQQDGGNVLHGAIREVSLVLAGANPGAYIDSVMSHGELSDEEAIIYTGEQLTLEHADPLKNDLKAEGKGNNMAVENNRNEETIQDVFDTLTDKQKDAFDTLTDKQKDVVYFLIGQAIEDAGGGETNASVAHADTQSSNEETIQDVFDTLTDKQKDVVYFLIGQAIEDAGVEGDTSMKHNIFDTDDEYMAEDTLSHSEMETIIGDAKRYGSLKDSFLAHADEYGITNINYLFRDAKNVTDTPTYIKRNTGWVSVVIGGTNHTPFSRIKSTFADITEDEARAKGYIKGNKKKDEVFSLLKRTTTPQTIYKKQKLDRDDIIDITGFDVVAWIKSEMRLMLDEEIARAVLVGDGRLASSDDKINESNIRPVWKDEDLYTIKTSVTYDSGATDDDKAKAFIRAAVKSRKEYKGSGNPTLFTTEDILTDCLLMEDKMGRVIYDSVDKLATAMRVSKIVTVPVLENLKRTDDKTKKDMNLLGIIVNLSDYTIGADKGGAINMFDDFDIDYNQQKYLIETRCSGALTVPYSAIVLETPASGTTTTGA